MAQFLTAPFDDNTGHYLSQLYNNDGNKQSWETLTTMTLDYKK